MNEGEAVVREARRSDWEGSKNLTSEPEFPSVARLNSLVSVASKVIRKPVNEGEAVVIPWVRRTRLAPKARRFAPRA